jgi:hypothetical protein
VDLGYHPIVSRKKRVGQFGVMLGVTKELGGKVHIGGSMQRVTAPPDKYRTVIQHAGLAVE